MLSRDHSYIQKTVFADENPLKQKARQSVYLLQMDTSLSIRNRSIGLAQLFSISRIDELVKWRLCELHLIKYPTSANLLEDSEMTALYLEQSDHKNYIDDRIPDKKIIVRRENIHLCPQSSLALMLFDR